MRYKSIFLLLFLILFLSGSSYSQLPYNYRLVEGHIHAGGHPLNPVKWFHSSDKDVLASLDFLKAQGVGTVIDLENTWWIQKRYQKLLDQAGMKRLHIPLSENKLPTPKEWQAIKVAMKQPVYIHCKWGADRTGAVIGRYLVEEKNYTPQKAYEAVITKGPHAGPLGGLKQGRSYQKLKNFVWYGPR